MGRRDADTLRCDRLGHLPDDVLKERLRGLGCRRRVIGRGPSAGHPPETEPPAYEIDFLAVEGDDGPSPKSGDAITMRLSVPGRWEVYWSVQHAHPVRAAQRRRFGHHGGRVDPGREPRPGGPAGWGLGEGGELVRVRPGQVVAGLGGGLTQPAFSLGTQVPRHRLATKPATRG